MLAFVLVSGSLWIILGEFRGHRVPFCSPPHPVRYLMVLHGGAVAGGDAPVSPYRMRRIVLPFTAGFLFAHPFSAVLFHLIPSSCLIALYAAVDASPARQ